MNKPPIIFNKKRELGQIIGDTFTFLRRNMKPLFSVLIRTCSIPFILLIVAAGFYAKNSTGLNITNINSLGDNITELLLSIGAISISGLLYNAMLYGSVSEYIKAYIAKGDIPDTTTVSDQIKNKIGSYVGLAFLNALIVLLIAIVPLCLAIFSFSSEIWSLGLLFILLTIVAMIYFYTKYTVIYPILTNEEDATLTSAFRKSGKLIKNEWWITFFTVLIMAILISLIGFIFQIPVVIYTMIKAFSSIQSGSLSDPSAIYDGVYVVLQTFASAASYILYVILAVSINFIYFNLNERKTQSGSLNQIDQIGS